MSGTTGSMRRIDIELTKQLAARIGRRRISEIDWLGEKRSLPNRNGASRVRPAPYDCVAPGACYAGDAPDLSSHPERSDEPGPRTTIWVPGLARGLARDGN